MILSKYLGWRRKRMGRIEDIENYSDDNCLYRAETNNPKCPRQGDNGYAKSR